LEDYAIFNLGSFSKRWWKSSLDIIEGVRYEQCMVVPCDKPAHHLAVHFCGGKIRQKEGSNSHIDTIVTLKRWKLNGKYAVNFSWFAAFTGKKGHGWMYSLNVSMKGG
jgi:hypothetical protein